MDVVANLQPETEMMCSEQILEAAENGDVVILMELIAQDPNLVDAVDEDGYSPLHRAAYNGYTEAAQILLENGANVEAKTNDGWHPLHSACNWDQVEVAAVLLGNGASVNAQTQGGQTPLHLAARNGASRPLLELLLMHRDADFSLRNSLGETAQDLASRYSKYHSLFEIADDSINNVSMTRGTRVTVNALLIVLAARCRRRGPLEALVSR
ncbi:hypothetical protein LSAT2_030329 [Lamellibrachia satsuma]|nr:hypothetical protein LSAT2_030329 [Lamellibrachia satsuma]